MEYILLLLGFVLLIKGADVFVDGSSSVAKLLRVPGFIIGLTVVSFGTSAPEAAVSISAGFAGSNEICLGNVIGSNMFNLLIVVGICSVISSMPAEKAIRRFDLPFSILITAALLVMCLDKKLSRLDGAILVLLFFLYLLKTILSARKNKEEGDGIKSMSAVKSVVFIIAGVVAVVLGGDLVVDNAVVIARQLGLSQTLISLTVIAMGTSLPELVTSMVAAKKGENGLALGNVVGSSIFNILFVLASSVTLNPIPVRSSVIVDLSVLIFVSLAMLCMVIRSDKYTAPKGAVMLMMYAAYAVYIFVRN